LTAPGASISSAERGTPSHEALQFLSSWAAERVTPAVEPAAD
jgi:hypothetical protein